MRVAADRASWSLVLVVLAVGCKSARAPDAAALADDLAQIEAELQRSDARLGDAGIVVAYRDARSAEDAASPPQESPAEPTAPAEAEPEAEPEPVVTPTPAPTTPSAEEPALAPDAYEDDAPRMSSRRSERERAPVRDRQDARESRRRMKKSARTRCERVCELTETTCELQDRVCALADDHPDDVRYEDACRRAEDQCEAATRSCESCAV